LRASAAFWSACASFGLPDADWAAAEDRLPASAFCSAGLSWETLAASWLSCEAAAWLSPAESAWPALAALGLAWRAWPAAAAACFWVATLGSWSDLI